MFRTRWRKLLRDFSVNKTRTFFVILAIFIGIFGISVVANSYSILLREMDINYLNTNPASATLWTSPIDDSYMQKIADLPYIKDVERREKIVGRVQVSPNEWKDIWLFVVDDFNNVRLDQFASEDGKEIPDSGEILIERKALSIANTDIGQTLNIKIPDSAIHSLNVVGTVHAPGLAPAWMEGYAYGFISKDTLRLLGGSSSHTELKILVAEDAMNKQHIKDNVYIFKDYLQNEGIQVTSIEIPKPGKHPHYDQMATLLFLMEIFGLLALILSGILVANVISAILNQQTKQIGIMKAIGGSSIQIAILYLGMVVVFSLSAMILSIPAGIFVGRGYAFIAATLLNFNIYSYDIPFYIFALEFSISLLVPTLIAAYPIIRGSQITVREAINDYGISHEKYTDKRRDISPKLLRIFSRPFLLSLRNTFRRRGRLIFTLLVMAAGGTGFIVAMNIYASMYNTVDAKIDSISYDIQVTFDHPHPVKAIENSIRQIPGVTEVETWGGANASRVYQNGTCGNAFSIIAPPSKAKLMEAPTLYDGRWLNENDTNALVINQRLLSIEPDIHVGDEIVLRMNQTDSKWKVIGISKELIGQPAAYGNSEYLALVLNSKGFAKNAMVVTDPHYFSSSSEVAKLIEQSMFEKGMHVNSLVKITDYQKAIEDHLLIIATFLIIMSILVVLVGGLGLSTTISINTLERTREIGIMRAIGASTYSITRIIMTEGIIIGIISFLISLLLSVPLSKFVSYNFGMIFFECPLEPATSILGCLIWFLVVIIFAALASFYPSWKASKLSVRNAVSYE